jgi:hypothetical protein
MSMRDDTHLPLDAWGDLRVGDRVYFYGAYGRTGSVPPGLQYELVELWSTTAPLSGDPDVLAVARDAHGEKKTVNVRVLRRLSTTP